MHGNRAKDNPKPRDHVGDILQGFSKQPFACALCGRSSDFQVYECTLQDVEVPTVVVLCYCGKYGFRDKLQCVFD